MKMKLLNQQHWSFFVVGIFLSLSINSFSQTVRCWSTEYDSIRHALNPDLQTNEEFEEWLAKEINAKQKLSETQLIINGVYQIPVVVHVIHNGEAVGTGTNVSQAVIQSQIDVLNEDFRRMMGSNGYNTHPDGCDTQIEFCLARRRPDGSAFPNGEDGINRINRNTAGFTAPPYNTGYIDGTIKPYCTVTQNWSPSKYMNFWCMNLGSGLLGYAQFPTTVLGGMGCGAQNQNTDGVVMLYSSLGKSSVTGYPGPYNEGRTATHEIGHWLGLRHIWGDGGCGVDDYCNDTPLSDAANYGCPNTNSCTDPAPDPNDMVQNYMDYTDDDCMNIFTYDQKMRMRTVLENSPIRASLITSDACIPPAVSDASVINIITPDGDNCAGPITPQVVLRNRGSSNLTSATIEYTIDNGAPTTFSWTGNIAPGNQTNVTLPAFTATLGNHVFKSRSLLPNGVTDPDPTYDESEITFAVSNGIQPNYVQNFDNGVFPPDVRWSVVNPNNDCYEWVGGACTSSTGVANNVAALMTNYQNSSNQDEYLYTPIFILPCNATTANLQFDVAYRRRTTTSTDRLRVEISTNCGATWQATSIYDLAGAALETVGSVSNSFWIPNAAGNWRTETVNLMSFVSGTSSTVQFRFRATNVGNGGNLYVDNVRLNAVTPGEIDLEVAGNDVLDGGYYNFGSQAIGSTTTATFTVNNTGTSNLILTGPISITGSPVFTLNTSFGTTTVPAGGSTTFSINFIPTGAGPFTGVVTFGTNDCDEGTYNFTLNGAGSVTPPTADFTGTPLAICSGSTVTYTDLSTAGSNWSWTFTGGTPATATGPGPHVVTYNTPGTFNTSLVVTNAYGSDTETKNNYVNVVSSTGFALPVSQGFVSTTFPPTNWSLSNGGNSVTWIRTGASGTAPTAGNCARIDNFNTNTTGDIDDINVVPVDLTGYSSATLTFDVAYARYNNTYFDRLDVLVSNDCGQTFTQVYSKSGSTLATDPDQTTAYTSPATWRNETVDLTPFIGSSKVEIKLRGISGYGQYVHIDNVNITGIVSSATADFNPSGSNVCVGTNVTFTDASTNATSWSWNFGAGATPSTATGQGPHVVTYATSGTKNISLSINGGADFDNQSITVNALDNAAFNYGASNYCTNTSDPVPTITGLAGGVFSSTAGLSINSSTGVIDVSASTPNVYSVTYTTNGTCPNSSSVNVTIVASPAVPVVNVVNNCGSSTLSTSGSNLLWSTGSTATNINVVSGGTYTVTQTVGGCTSAQGSGIAAPTPIPSTPVVNVVNNCGSSTLSTTGSNLLWSTGANATSINVTSGGTYTVTQTVGGCTSLQGSGIAAPSPVPVISTTFVNPASCGATNGSITVNGTGVGTISWSGQASGSAAGVTLPYTITGLGSGPYSIIFNNGCPSSTANQGLTDPSAPSAPSVSVTNNCGSSILTATGSNITWSTGETSASITVTAGGTYSATQTITGCTSSSANITANPIPIPSAPSVTVNDGCGVSTLIATGSNLMWSTGESTGSIDVTSSGSYNVNQTVAGCVSSDATVNANPIPVPSAPVLNVSDGCGESVLTATGSNIAWSTGESTTSITVTSAGTYAANQTVGGCVSSDASIVSNPTPIPSAPVVTVQDNCENSTLSATGSNLSWSTGETTPSITVSSAGNYTVTQTVGGCESSETTITATPFTNPSVSFGSLSTMCDYNPAYVLTEGSPSGGTYSGPGVNSGQFDPGAAGVGTWQLTYTYTDVNGCVGSANSVINVDPCLSIENPSLDSWIVYPNPTSGMVYIENTALIQEYKVFDFAGRLVLESSNVNMTEISLDLSKFADGVYHIELTSKHSIDNIRIVLKK